MITAEVQGAVTVLSAAVALNTENAEQFLEAVESHSGQGLPQMVFDMAQVPLLDSVALEAILDARAAVRGRGGVIKLAGPRPLVEDILIATGVGDHFEIFPNSKSAVGSFSR